MDQRVNSAIHDRQAESFGRVANMTMDVMIPDEIQSELISDASLDRRKADAENFAEFKAGGEETAVEQSTAGVGVEPVLNNRKNNSVEYEAGKETCPVKTETVADVDMTGVSEQTENTRYESDKTDPKWDAGMAKSTGNEMDGVKPVVIGEGAYAATNFEKGLPFPVKVKMEPGAGVEAAENRSGTPVGVMYPVKTELDLNAEIMKAESGVSAEGTASVSSHLHADATIAAAQWPKSTATGNIPLDVVPNMYIPATALVEGPAPAAVHLNPAKIVSNMPGNVKTVPDHHGNSTVKSLFSDKFVQNMPGVASSAELGMANGRVESSGRKVIPGRMMPNIPIETAANNASGKRRVHPKVATNATAARSDDFPIQSTAQKHVQVKTAPCLTSAATISPNHMTGNEMFKFPIKIESEQDLDRLAALARKESMSVHSKATVRGVGNFIESKKYGGNVEGGKSGRTGNPSEIYKALPDAVSAKKGVVGGLDTEFVCGPYALKTLPSGVGSHSNTKIDENSLRINARQAIHVLPRLDEAHTQSYNMVNEMRSADKVFLTPSTEVSLMSPTDFGIKPKSFRKPRKEKLEVKKDIEFEIIPLNAVGEKKLKSQRDSSLNELEIPGMPPEVAAELTDIAIAIRMSNKSAAELVREHGPRVKELWKACRNAYKKPGVKTKTNRRQEFKAWVMSAGEPGVYIMKTIARSVADYTRKRREKIKQLAEAGDPEALEVFSRVLENRRKFIERRRALKEAGGPAAMAMAQRARDRERRRRAQKALLKAANCCRDRV